ncbi:IS110 family transposase [Roseobacter cerasinus]|uniref:IS110 family transposase n=1 Tax=Roseobacter cerasinus TaxID=2602289 RepID=UPI0013572BB7|nr:IS110 family transposase [Roseobacter cerasinus]
MAVAAILVFRRHRKAHKPSFVLKSPTAASSAVLFVELVRDVREELNELDQRIAAYTKRIRDLFQSDDICQRIGKIEGTGPITATALVALVGGRTCFKNGRQFAARLGFVPKQRSSGGKSRLFGISKHGDRYLCTLLIHGARAALRKAGGKTDARSLWIERMPDRRHPNVVAVALANKNVRIVWVVLSDRTGYQPAFTGYGDAWKSKGLPE